MINGPLANLLDEARQHWQHILSMAPVIRQALPLQEWIRIAVVAVVTASVTSQITLARLDERITASQSERMLIIKNRDAQVAEIKRNHEAQMAEIKVQLERLDVRIRDLQVQLAGRVK